MRWGYKTVHFELKKEGLLGSGVLDESEIEQELNEFGQNGWELVSVLEVQDGIIVIFKQPLDHHLAPPVYPQEEAVVEETLQDEYIQDEEPDALKTVDDQDQDSPEEHEDGSTIGAIRIE